MVKLSWSLIVLNFNHRFDSVGAWMRSCFCQRCEETVRHVRDLNFDMVFLDIQVLHNDRMRIVNNSGVLGDAASTNGEAVLDFEDTKRLQSIDAEIKQNADRGLLDSLAELMSRRPFAIEQVNVSLESCE